jgi:hypothetical protein
MDSGAVILLVLVLAALCGAVVGFATRRLWPLVGPLLLTAVMAGAAAVVAWPRRNDPECYETCGFELVWWPVLLLGIPSVLFLVAGGFGRLARLVADDRL